MTKNTGKYCTCVYELLWRETRTQARPHSVNIYILYSALYHTNHLYVLFKVFLNLIKPSSCPSSWRLRPLLLIGPSWIHVHLVSFHSHTSITNQLCHCPPLTPPCLWVSLSRLPKSPILRISSQLHHFYSLYLHYLGPVCHSSICALFYSCETSFCFSPLFITCSLASPQPTRHFQYRTLASEETPV